MLQEQKHHYTFICPSKLIAFGTILRQDKSSIIGNVALQHTGSGIDYTMFSSL